MDKNLEQNNQLEESIHINNDDNINVSNDLLKEIDIIKKNLNEDHVFNLSGTSLSIIKHEHQIKKPIRRRKSLFKLYLENEKKNMLIRKENEQ